MTIFRRLIAMQLHGLETNLIRDARALLRHAFIDEHADAHHLVGQLLDNAARVHRTNVTRAARIEIEAERVRTGINSHERIFEIRNAADFNESHSEKQESESRIQNSEYQAEATLTDSAPPFLRAAVLLFS